VLGLGSAGVIAVGAGAVVLALGLAASGLGASGTAAALLPAMVLLGFCGIAAALARPRWVFLAFVVGCMVIPFVFEEVSVPLGFMKLYVQDVVFAWNLLICAVRWSVGRHAYKPLPLNRYILGYFLLGVWGLFVGFLVSHNEFDDTFGDFRRSYFYFMNYFIAVLLVDNLKDTRYLRRALLLGATLAALKGLFEISAGQFVYRRFGDAAHVLTHFEITFLMFMIYYALAQVVFRADRNRLWWSVPILLGVVVVLIGNFRACWLSLLGGLMFFFCFLPRRQRFIMVMIGAMGAAFVGLAIATMWDLQVTEGHSTVGQEILAKADVKNTTSDINVIWRFESYANAIQQWKRSPFIGTGLGEVLEFSATTSTGGAMLATGHRVHNSLLWLLMSQGILGFAAIVYIQSRYVISVIRYVRRSTWLEGRTTVLACGAFYVSVIVTACFEILLESAMPITVLSSTMALAMLMMYYTPKPETETTAYAEPTVG
jgi:hypothetical protein